MFYVTTLLVAHIMYRRTVGW